MKQLIHVVSDNSAFGFLGGILHTNHVAYVFERQVDKENNHKE
jgi:hypothetical protein